MGCLAAAPLTDPSRRRYPFRSIITFPQQYTSAKFHLVDLAGSERNKKTGTSGERFREAVNINGGCAVRPEIPEPRPRKPGTRPNV